MYYLQLGAENHHYRLRYADGSNHRGVVRSSSHLYLMVAFFEKIVEESAFAENIRKRSIETGVPIDDLIEEELDHLTALYDLPDEYIVGLVGRDDFLMWLYAREKLLDHDESKLPRGLA